MSSEESAYADSSNSEDDDGAVQTDSESSSQRRPRRKRLIRHTLPWRSVEFRHLIESLDRKIDRRRSDRSRSMCLEVEVNQDVESNRSAPHDIPDWAKELFS